FKYIGPILRRVLLRRPADARLQDLKHWPQILVTLWVLTVIPVLLFQLGLILTQVPHLVTKDWWMMQQLATRAANGVDALELVGSGLQIILLGLPLVGVTLILFGMTRRPAQWAVRYVNGPTSDPIPGS